MATRREFLSNVGAGMLLAGLGPGVLEDLGIALRPDAGDGDGELDFGELEALVAMMETTELGELLPRLVAELRAGTDLSRLVAAGALANARSFGGHDYDGYHAFMALAPSLRMAEELGGPTGALPVLKVLYRNTARIHAVGGSHAMRAVEPSDEGAAGMREACREGDLGRCETALAGLARQSPEAARGGLLPIVYDDAEVHRIVLAWRALDMVDLTGGRHAEALMRQSVGFCVDAERDRARRGKGEPEVRRLLPKLVEEHGLAGRPPGSRDPGDEWVDRTAWTLVRSSSAEGAATAAAALADGIHPEAVGEALSLASTRLLLCDRGRSSDGDRGRQKGSVHGASVGVHASDSAHAWRNVARVSEPLHATACCIAGAYHAAGQGRYVGSAAIAFADHEGARSEEPPERLLRHACECIDTGDQLGACAFVWRYAQKGGAPDPFFRAMLEYCTDQDGALHAEKYYRTARSVHGTARTPFAAEHLVALARVVASQEGDRAPGVDEARELLRG